MKPAGLISLLLLPLGLAALAAAQAPPTQADGYAPPEYLRRPPELPPRPGQAPARRLRMSDAVERVLSHNLGLQLERERVREVREVRRVALGAFEPVLTLSGRYDSAQSPPQTAQEGEAGQVLSSNLANWRLSLSQRLPTGGLLGLDFTTDRSDSDRGTAVQPLLYRSRVSLVLTQPLLRDFSFDGQVQLAPLLRARFDGEAAREQARLRALLTVKMTEDAYLTLVERWRRYEVSLRAQELAERQLALTRRQIAAGILPESEVIGVEGTLAQRQVAVVGAEAQIEEAADALRRLLNLPAGEWEQPLLPQDVPEFSPVRVPFSAAWERAVAGRPELRQASLDLRRVALDLRLARNARLPRLNLQGAVAAVGQDADYEQALSQVGARAGFEWSVGAELGWAPLTIGARAEVRRLEAVLRQRGLSREQWLMDVRVQLRAALRGIDTAERQLYAAARSRDLAERALEVEERRFLHNLVSNFVVGQRQAEVAQAQLAEVQALIQHQRASSDLLLATGELLEARGVRFEVR